MSAVIEKRVDNLEELMAELIKAGKEAEERSKQANERSMQADERSMQADERSRQADERSRQADERLAAYIARSDQKMEEFSRELREDRAKLSQEIREATRQYRKEMGEITNRMGRLVEDAVYPGIPKIFKQITGLDDSAIKQSSIRVKKTEPTQREFDAVIIGGEYVLINETKSTLNPETVKKFYNLMKDDIHTYFPEYAGKKFIGVVSSLYVDESIVQQGSKLGLYVLGFKEDLMDVLNPAEFKPMHF